MVSSTASPIGTRGDLIGNPRDLMGGGRMDLVNGRGEATGYGGLTPGAGARCLVECTALLLELLHSRRGMGCGVLPW